MKAAIVVLLRNKERWCAQAIRSAMAQSRPMTIIISDHGSTDRSRDVAASVVKGYKGPHEVILTTCPDRTAPSMTGLNAHLAWLVSAFDHEAFIVLPADDTIEPDNAAMIIDAFEKTGASAVGVHRRYVNPERGQPDMVTPFPKESRFVTAAEHFDERVGGSTFQAFTRDLWDFAPVLSDTISDVWLPYWAICKGGYYVVADKILGSYYNHADLNNTGLEGVRRAAKTPVEIERVNERIWLEILRTCSRAMRHGVDKEQAGWTWPMEPQSALMRTILSLAVGYAGSHDLVKRLEAEATA